MLEPLNIACILLPFVCLSIARIDKSNKYLYVGSDIHTHKLIRGKFLLYSVSSMVYPV